MMKEACTHKWFTRSEDDFCYCMYCMEEWEEYDARVRKIYKQKMAKMIRNVREGLGLSQQKFSVYLGADSARTIRYWESGERELPIWVSNKIIELAGE